MILDLFLVPLAAAALFLFALWEGLQHIAIAFQWPSWVPAAVIAGLVPSCVLVHLATKLVGELEMLRERRELSVMEQQYPHCHVVRLSSGRWFLTEKATGREFRPDDQPAEAGRTLQA